MSLSTCYLEYGRHVARLCRRRRRRAYAPTSDTASHDNHEKINSWVSFCFPYELELRYYSATGVRLKTRILKERSTSLALWPPRNSAAF